MIRINVDGVSATVTAKEILTAGRVGLECEFTFSGEWDGLFKTAVFQGVETVEVPLLTAVCTVPWEAMQTEGVQLKIGVYGANGGGTIVIPTVWANAGKILPSAGTVTQDAPTQTVIAYTIETANEALSIARSVQEAAANGNFDGAPGADGADGAPGADGADGFSPTATVSKVGNTATITITDENGTTTAVIHDGADGEDGADGSKIWNTTVEPLESLTGTFTFQVSNLNGASGTPAVGDLIFYDSAYYPIAAVINNISNGREAIANYKASIRGADGATGATGQQGPAGQGVPAGGTTGQVLKKKSGSDYDTEWANESGGGTGLTNEVKQALLQIGQKVAYIDAEGQQYYNDLMAALYPIQSISAVYTQSGEVYTDDTLDDLTADLVVTATYDGGTTEVIPATDYVLSGSLTTAGAQAITVSYMGKTTTFSVTVTAPLYSIPDFAAQTISSGGKSATVKKENGVYTISGTIGTVVYIYPNGTVNTTKSNTLWFSSESDKPLKNQMIDVSWSNPGATETSLQSKLSQSDASGNLAAATVTMTANSSGHEELVEFSNDAYPARNFSALVFQLSSTRTYSASASFRIRIFSNGVRYL